MRTEIALEKFKQGYNCAQSVLCSYSDLFDISQDNLLKMANGFGSGMARRQETCGAVTGGIIVLGLLYGRGENQEKSEQEKCYKKVHELTSKFELIYKSSKCINLLDNCKLDTSEGQERFVNEKMKERCSGYIKTVVELLNEIIKTNNKVN